MWKKKPVPEYRISLFFTDSPDDTKLVQAAAAFAGREAEVLARAGEEGAVEAAIKLYDQHYHSPEGTEAMAKEFIGRLGGALIRLGGDEQYFENFTEHFNRLANLPTPR